jgi:large subunit ribosomal protein L3
MATKGILGTKLGMTQVFDDDANVVPVTVIKAGPCPVVQVRDVGKDGYRAVQLGFGAVKRTNKALAGHFAKAGVDPTRHLVEFQLAGDHAPGDLITVDAFAVGEYIDATARSKGKGFTGVMKRHGFAGLGAGHGVHKVHRAPGSIGGASTPGRVFPGMKMAGRSGNERVTVQSLEVVAVEAERGLLLIRGATPGANGALITIRDAAKKKAVATAGGDA